MSIRQITKEQLRRMGDREGLVLQGCGGDPQEWLDGINEILTNKGILKKGAGFEEAYTFQHDGPHLPAVSLQGKYGAGYGKACRMAVGYPFYLRLKKIRLQKKLTISCVI